MLLALLSDWRTILICEIIISVYDCIVQDNGRFFFTTIWIRIICYKGTNN